MEQKKHIEYAIKLTAHILSIFDEESDNYIDQQELDSSENLTDFIHALSNMLPTTIYNKLTGDNKNNLNFNHVANTLCFQYSKEV